MLGLGASPGPICFATMCEVVGAGQNCDTVKSIAKTVAGSLPDGGDREGEELFLRDRFVGMCVARCLGGGSRDQVGAAGCGQSGTLIPWRSTKKMFEPFIIRD
jgi:hypothetical protein